MIDYFTLWTSKSSSLPVSGVYHSMQAVSSRVWGQVWWAEAEKKQQILGVRVSTRGLLSCNWPMHVSDNGRLHCCHWALHRCWLENFRPLFWPPKRWTNDTQPMPQQISTRDWLCFLWLGQPNKDKTFFCKNSNKEGTKKAGTRSGFKVLKP